MNTKLQRHLKDKSRTKKDRNNDINRPVRTAGAVAQYYNAAMHITMQNTQRQLYNTPATRPTSYHRCGRKKVSGALITGERYIRQLLLK